MNRQTGSFIAFHKDKPSETLYEYTDFKNAGLQDDSNAELRQPNTLGLPTGNGSVEGKGYL
jgi:hypothetical protein